jgi:hypothetical protein
MGKEKRLNIRTGLLPLAAFMVAAMCVVSGGCGDGDSSSGSAGGTIETSSLTKAEFTKRANRICLQGMEDALRAFFTYVRKNEGDSMDNAELETEGMHQLFLPKLEAQTDEIESLGAPSGDEDQIEAFLVAQRRSITSLAQRRELSLATNLDPAFRQSGRLARQYGIESCAYG